MAESCPGLVAAAAALSRPLSSAASRSTPIRCASAIIGHATFLIESPQLVRIATDYNDYVRPPMLPDIVTMNHAHYDALHGSVPTRRSSTCCAAGPATKSRRASTCSTKTCACATCRPISAPGTGGTERHGNSIFIFEVGQSVHRASRPPASHVDAAAAQRNRPGRRGDGAGRWQLHARPRRHGRGAALRSRRR